MVLVSFFCVFCALSLLYFDLHYSVHFLLFSLRSALLLTVQIKNALKCPNPIILSLTIDIFLSGKLPAECKGERIDVQASRTCRGFL